MGSGDLCAFGLLAASLLIAAGDAFRSGADEALVAAMTLSEAAGAWTSARVWRNDGRLHPR